MFRRLKNTANLAFRGVVVLAALIVAVFVVDWAWPVYDSAPRSGAIPEWTVLLGNQIETQASNVVQRFSGISGIAMLQGRDSHEGIIVELDGVAAAVTDEKGAYAISRVVTGTHTLAFSHPNYLKAGMAVTVVQSQQFNAPLMELRGGDVNGDGIINLKDLRQISISILFGTRVGNDVNGNGKTDVGDLAMAGGNFNRTDTFVEGRLFNMERTLAVLRTGGNGDAEEAIDSVMNALYGGPRPLVSKGAGQSQTKIAHEAMSKMESEVVEALLAYSERGDADKEFAGRAFNLALLVSHTNSIAQTASAITSRCAMGDTVSHPFDPDNQNPASPCNQLIPLMGEGVSNENPFVAGGIGPAIGEFPVAFELFPSYSIALRAEIVPPRWTREIPELVEVAGPIADGECASVFKETRGLQLRLHLERIDVVGEPWNSVFDDADGTNVPIWSLEWQPAEYVKVWEMCNTGGDIEVERTHEVKRDVPLNFFWRFYQPGQ